MSNSETGFQDFVRLDSPALEDARSGCGQVKLLLFSCGRSNSEYQPKCVDALVPRSERSIGLAKQISCIPTQVPLNQSQVCSSLAIEGGLRTFNYIV